MTRPPVHRSRAPDVRRAVGRDAESRPRRSADVPAVGTTLTGVPFGPEWPTVGAPSWDEIAERYGDTVYAMAYRLTGDGDEARDLAQDVFVRVYRNLDRYRPGTFEGWLYRITRNLFLDRVRRRSRVRMEPLPEGEWREPRETDPGPDERAVARILDEDLEAAIADLPSTFRTAVVLCDVRGLSYEEIVERTGWPMGTVRSRIHRGRKLLRQRLAQTRGRSEDPLSD